MKTNQQNHTLCSIDLTDAIRNHSADKTICYSKAENKELFLGFYFPDQYTKKKTYPVFIMIHGGGWSSHKVFQDQLYWQGDYLGYLARYYAQNGFFAVSIDYRLIEDLGQKTNFGIWESYLDCLTAIEYLLTHASEYSLDLDRLYLLGESAGGHLAGLTACSAHHKNYRFKKVYLLNPITNFDDPKWQTYVPLHPTVNPLKELSFTERCAYLSPSYQATSAIDEIILIHGKEDTTVHPSHSIDLYKKLCELSCPCELHLLDHMKHAFMLPEYYKNADACKLGIEIINNSL